MDETKTRLDLKLDEKAIETPKGDLYLGQIAYLKAAEAAPNQVGKTPNE